MVGWPLVGITSVTRELQPHRRVGFSRLCIHTARLYIYHSVTLVQIVSEDLKHGVDVHCSKQVTEGGITHDPRERLPRYGARMALCGRSKPRVVVIDDHA